MASCTPSLPDDVAAAYKTLPTEKIDFNRHVKPVLSDRCFSCHGPDKGKLEAGLRLDIPEMAYGELPETPGKRAIVPGSLRKSELFHRIISTDPGYVMPDPKSNLKLTAYEKAVLIKWIEDGAEYKPHWAFIKPVKPTVPEVADK
ncbi:MAG TPA: c-type cytochrome domain-containing protein, partial [Flavisolibacter sp.]|nr:c-type cytochrome domain-containing protein [Flavisolibacter sp.]